MENSWVMHPSFADLANANWNSVGPTHSHLSPVSILCLKLKRVRAAARVWARDRKLPPIYLLNCRAIISLFNRLEERRHISALERRIRSLAKTTLSQKKTPTRQCIGGNGPRSKTASLAMKTSGIFTFALRVAFAKIKSKTLKIKNSRW
jgi:7-keto-8-aminopelargonate synthetase-like enzyme